MAFNIDDWVNEITAKLKTNFSERLLFVGLQGSYNRNEANIDSDIDLVVILDSLNFEDIKSYKNIIDTMQYKEKACGFISGKSELAAWSKTDLFQFFYDTKPIYGSLFEIAEPPSKEDVRVCIKTSCESLYHSAIHSFLHSDDCKSDLANFYKAAFFVLQAKYYVKNSIYIPTKIKLYDKLDGLDKKILEICINRQSIANKATEEIEFLYKQLIEWCYKEI